MIHLFKVYFDAVADAQQVYAEDHNSAAKYVARRRVRKVEDAVVRYVMSVSRMDAKIPLAHRGKEIT